MADKEKKVAEAAGKTNKPEKEKGKLGHAWRGFKSEVKKIVWPSWAHVVKNTCVVLVVMVICAGALWALDYVCSQGIIALTNLFAK